ncbi:exo-alpha-sialidase [Microbacterium arabinogalactanolyticum]|uniref:exo-alpha-sialidase n=1 Tax=Microbacterium arabinogalactanolyticum TaxID=69365 RepID=UPI004044921F
MRKFASTLAGLSMAVLLALGVAGPAFADLDHTTWANAGNNAVVARDCDGQPGVQCRAYFPDLAIGNQGELILVYRWASSHVGSRGDIRMKKSTDGGATWTGEQVIASSTSDLRDPSITRLSTGRLIVSYFTYDQTASAVIGTQTRTSDNDGASWAAPVNVTSTLPHAATSAKIIEVRGTGELLIPLYGKQGSDPNNSIVIVRSTDKGVSWSGNQKTIASGSGTTDWTEPAIAELEDGHLRVIARTNANGFQYDSYSGTYMTTWTPTQDLGVPMHAPELFRVPGTNKVVNLWSQPSGSSRPVMVKMRYLDQYWGATLAETLYQPFKDIWDAGYSGTALVGSSLVTAVYDSSVSGLFIQRYDVADIEGSYTPKLDLMAEYNAGTVSISTDMTATDPAHPEMKPTGAIDGSTAYFNTAAKGSPAPAVYTIDLKTVRQIGKIGIALKPQNPVDGQYYPESATVYTSTDGTNWTAVQSYTTANTTHLDAKLLGGTISVRYVRVNVTASAGWATLNEVALYGFAPYTYGHAQS